MHSIAQVSPSDIDFPYNHLPWYTIEGEHFLIHYQEGSETTAGAASLIAHQVYVPITKLYNYEPERKVSIVLRDRQDYSNGAAYFFDDKIDIWIPPLDTPLRGTHQWLRNVITHEFTHIVQMGASMKRPAIIQSVYLQWLSYEDVRRPDVLYGSPNGIITHPFSTVSIPAWFSEGTAQYMRENIFYDYWDSHRDMILRMNVLYNNTLDFVEMGYFSSKTSIEREMVYNQGFDFVNYLTGRFGEQVIGELANESSDGESNFGDVMNKVTGISGSELYEDWIRDRKEKYVKQVQDIEPLEALTVEKDGFMNFYPQYNTQEEIFAYLTNRERDYGTTQLLIQTPDSTLEVDELIKPEMDKSSQHHSIDFYDFPGLTIDFVGNRFSFSPNGKKIAYSKTDENRFGEEYHDVYIFDIDSLKSTKITTDARIQDPAWHPSDSLIAAVQLKNGTQNIVLLNPGEKEIRQLTNFKNGETVYTPVWSPKEDDIYFSSADVNSRNLYKMDVKSRELSPLFENEWIDFRDPWVDPAGNFLYFSSDADGIFNIYRKHIDQNSIQKITDVYGGAFMPFAAKDSLFFSEYKANGYKISAISLPEFSKTHQTNDLIEIEKNRPITNISAYDKSIDLSHIHDSLKAANSTQKIVLSEKDLAESVFSRRPYDQTTTGLGIIPVVRFDNYSKLKGNNTRLIGDGRFGDLGKNLVRDFKAGAYFTSRDVTENFSIFGGALFGWGSLEAESFTDFFSPNRLNNLDRDLFFIIDHRGIPFIKRSWSPTISIEVYNLKRNVRDGISIEEFPCTSCFPIQKSIDIRYNVWEANLFLRSKINQYSLFELGASYSPYSVATDSFYSDEFNQFIPGSATEYFKGTSYSASYYVDTRIPSRHSDIATEGALATVAFRVENGRLLQEFEIEDGSLSPVYSQKTNYSIELKNQFGGTLGDAFSTMLTTRIFSYFNNPNDYFYLDYAGGLTGMRSYPYFAIGGQRSAWGRISLLAPLKRNINKQLGAYTLDKLYAHVFLEAGNGWGGPLDIGTDLKTGIGTELRFALNSYYLFPLKFFINTTYGFNRFNVTLPDQFISTSSENSINYGKEVLFYFGLTFDFNQF